jgi:protease II
LNSLYHFAFANKDTKEKQWVLDNTQMSEDEFTALYDLGVATSLGSAIASVDKLAATSYKCASADLCTPNELTQKQWLSSEITMDIPTDFEGNEFLNIDGETCLSKAWKLKDD